ncbi:hypothetical protein F4824DRAFT_516135 [Ustulina deusta]|nr:hypothetical protein F4824DRAFT_516135 [Ustulina deusta]
MASGVLVDGTDTYSTWWWSETMRLSLLPHRMGGASARRNEQSSGSGRPRAGGEPGRRGLEQESRNTSTPGDILLATHRRNHRFYSGPGRNYSTTFPGGTTLWMPSLSPPPPAVLTPARETVFRSSFRYPAHANYDEYSERSDGTREPSINRGSTEKGPSDRLQPVALPPPMLPAPVPRRLVSPRPLWPGPIVPRPSPQLARMPGDPWQWSRTRTPPPPPLPPLPLLTSGQHHVSDLFRDSSTSSVERSSQPPSSPPISPPPPPPPPPPTPTFPPPSPPPSPSQASTSAADKHGTAATVANTNDTRSGDAPSPSAPSPPRGLAMVRLAGPTHLSKPNISRPGFQPARSDIPSDRYLTDVRATKPGRVLEYYLSPGVQEVVLHLQRRWRREQQRREVARVQDNWDGTALAPGLTNFYTRNHAPNPVHLAPGLTNFGYGLTSCEPEPELPDGNEATTP